MNNQSEYILKLYNFQHDPDRGKNKQLIQTNLNKKVKNIFPNIATDYSQDIINNLESLKNYFHENLILLNFLAYLIFFLNRLKCFIIYIYIYILYAFLLHFFCMRLIIIIMWVACRIVNIRPRFF